MIYSTSPDPFLGVDKVISFSRRPLFLPSPHRGEGSRANVSSRGGRGAPRAAWSHPSPGSLALTRELGTLSPKWRGERSRCTQVTAFSRRGFSRPSFEWPRTASLRAKRSNPVFSGKSGLLPRFVPRNDDQATERTLASGRSCFLYETPLIDSPRCA